MISKIVIENPNTYDDINNYVTLLGASLVILLLIIAIKFKGKKKKKKRRK